MFLFLFFLFGKSIKMIIKTNLSACDYLENNNKWFFLKIFFPKLGQIK